MEAEHPGMSGLSCKDCQTYLTSIPDGEIKTHETVGEDGKRVMVKTPRLPVWPTPCSECPRGGPENESKYKMTPSNRRVVGIYRDIQAAKDIGLSIPEVDPLLFESLREMSRLTKYQDKEIEANLLASKIAQFFIR